MPNTQNDWEVFLDGQYQGDMSWEMLRDKILHRYVGRIAQAFSVQNRFYVVLAGFKYSKTTPPQK